MAVAKYVSPRIISREKKINLETSSPHEKTQKSFVNRAHRKEVIAFGKEFLESNKELFERLAK
jgi:hypothetical protein